MKWGVSYFHHLHSTISGGIAYSLDNQSHKERTRLGYSAQYNIFLPGKTWDNLVVVIPSRWDNLSLGFRIPPLLVQPFKHRHIVRRKMCVEIN